MARAQVLPARMEFSWERIRRCCRMFVFPSLPQPPQAGSCSWSILGNSTHRFGPRPSITYCTRGAWVYQHPSGASFHLTFVSPAQFWRSHRCGPLAPACVRDMGCGVARLRQSCKSVCSNLLQCELSAAHFRLTGQSIIKRSHLASSAAPSLCCSDSSCFWWSAASSVCSSSFVPA